MENKNTITVEVAYARPEEQLIIPIEVKPGTTVTEAIKLSGILEHFPEIDLDKNDVGIFGKIAPGNTELRERDRVEIYRPLIADPKESRRKRAAKKDEQKSAEGEDA